MPMRIGSNDSFNCGLLKTNCNRNWLRKESTSLVSVHSVSLIFAKWLNAAAPVRQLTQNQFYNGHGSLGRVRASICANSLFQTSFYSEKTRIYSMITHNSQCLQLSDSSFIAFLFAFVRDPCGCCGCRCCLTSVWPLDAIDFSESHSPCIWPQSKATAFFL